MLINLRILRESKGLTQQNLASVIGVSQQAIQKYETGKNEPDLETLMKLADTFKVSVDYLIGHTPQGKDPNYAISSIEFEMIESYRKLETGLQNIITELLLQLPEKKK